MDVTQQNQNLEYMNAFKSSTFGNFTSVEQQQLFFQLFSEKFSNFSQPPNPVQETQDIIKLNVGGKLFITTKSTLFNVENTLKSMLQSGNFKPDLDGAYFIDRSPEYFPLILDYLRNPTKDLRILSSHLKETRQKIDFQYELDFYCIQQEETEGLITIDSTSASLDLNDYIITKEKGKYGYAFASERLKMNNLCYELSFEFLQVPLGGEVSVYVGLTEKESCGSALFGQKVPKYQIKNASKGDAYSFVFDTKELLVTIYKNNEQLETFGFTSSENWFPCIEMDSPKHEKTSVLLK